LYEDQQPFFGAVTAEIVVGVFTSRRDGKEQNHRLSAPGTCRRPNKTVGTESIAQKDFFTNRRTKV